MNVEPWSTISAPSTAWPVRAIQHLLRSRGHAVPVTNAFDAATTAAVTAFQGSAGLPASGTVDPNTWRTLVRTVRSGDTGDAVKALQSLQIPYMAEMPELAVDGSFGPLTTDRVTHFQQAWGLGSDGVVGPETWSFLSVVDRPWPLVKVGSTQATNWRVLAAQHLLRASGATIAADGSFGPASGEAIRTWQAAHRATFVSTTVGQLDWPGLIRTVRRPDTGDAVRAVQTLLPVTTVDGSFGPATETAVRELQGMFGLTVDGIVGPATWHSLVVPAIE